MFQDHHRVLFVQLRDDDMRDHEREVFQKTAHIGARQVTYLDAFTEDAPEAALDGHDALIIGGSGDYLLSQGHVPAQIEKAVCLARAARRRGMPILGICFGGQILTKAFGGDVQLDVSRKETGTFAISRTPRSAGCPLFAELPDTFAAVLGHQDHIERLPEGAVHLASSARSRHQAWTFPGEPVYALTFHPELDLESVTARLHYYADRYGLTQEEVDVMVKDFDHTPHATRVIRLFLDKIVAQGARYAPHEAHEEEMPQPPALRPSSVRTPAIDIIPM